MSSFKSAAQFLFSLATLLLLLLAFPAHAWGPSLPKVDKAMPAMDSEKIHQLASLLSTIAKNSSKIGHMIDAGNAGEIPRQFFNLDGDIDSFAMILKKLLDSKHHSTLDSALSMTKEHLATLKEYSSDKNVAMAKAEYQRFLSAWQTLEKIYRENITS